MAGEPTEKPFSIQKKKFVGGNLKDAKGFSGGAQRAGLPSRRRG